MAAQDVLAEVKEAFDRNDLETALAIIENFIRVEETLPQGLSAMAAVAFRQGDVARALTLLEHVADIKGVSTDAHEILAVLNCLAGRLTDALFCAKMASTVTMDSRLLPLFGPDLPKFADAFANIGERPLLRAAKAANRKKSVDMALNLVQQHLSLFPNDLDALELFSEILEGQGKVEEVIGVLRSVQTLGGQSATLLSRLARALRANGEVDAAMACHDLAMLRAPKSIAIHAAALMDWMRHPYAGCDQHVSCQNAWKELVVAKTPKVVRPSPPVSQSGRRTIGYLCAGVESEDMKVMVGRVAANHDRTKFTVAGFGSGDLGDQQNLAYRNAFQRWREISQLDDLTLAALIRGESIDVLIDCDGLAWPGHNAVFVRNCARTQMNWLSMPSGLSLPGAHGSLSGYSLPSGPYLLNTGEEIAVDLPAKAAGGGVTFGADIAAGDLNSNTALAVSLILQAVPGSTFVLRDDGILSQPDRVTRMIDMFGNFGVAHRIDIAGGSRSEFWSICDVALASLPSVNPFAYGEALAGGLPVVVLKSGQATGLAASVAAVGFAESMVADDAAGYVAKAVAWAQDLDRLAAHRRDSRRQVLSSAVFDAQKFTAGLEEHLRSLVAEPSVA